MFINLIMYIYCITHKKLDFIEKLGLIPCGVGENEYPENYIQEKYGENISHKNYNYGEITFHYWLWKNKLKNNTNDDWFGICHYRRFFLNKKNDYQLKNIKELKPFLINKPDQRWKNNDVILCEPISLQNYKKTKIIKKAFKSLIKDPKILFDNSKHTIKLHFQMYHGYENLDKAIRKLPLEERSDFEKYIATKTSFSPNCMYLSNNPVLVCKFYESLFEWLSNCESIFGFSKTKDYGTRRIYTFLTERYLPYWFEKYARVNYLPWLFLDNTKIN